MHSATLDSLMPPTPAESAKGTGRSMVVVAAADGGGVRSQKVVKKVVKEQSAVKIGQTVVKQGWSPRDARATPCCSAMLPADPGRILAESFQSARCRARGDWDASRDSNPRRLSCAAQPSESCLPGPPDRLVPAQRAVAGRRPVWAAPDPPAAGFGADCLARSLFLASGVGGGFGRRRRAV